MEISQELQPQIMCEEAKYKDPPQNARTNNNSSVTNNRINYSRWLKISIYIIFLLSGQSIALILGRLYFVKGGNAQWLSTLVQLIGFPILIPFYFITKKLKNSTTNIEFSRNPPPFSTSSSTLIAIYTSTGLLIAVTCFSYSVGLKYLPVSTYTLICSSQLAFNSLFSFFLNSQKFTPFIINSLVLLTISSVLLVFNNESASPTSISKAKYAIGFVCTVVASAGYGLTLSLTQFFFKRFIKTNTFKAIMDMLIYQQIVASFVTIIALFASGEWSHLTREMTHYQLGEVSYVMNLVWTAVFWQVFSIGNVGLIFEVSALFSNAISTLGLPIVPVAAVLVFHDKMDGIKVISMVLAIWGFISYVYQHYLDDKKDKAVDKNTNHVSESSSVL